MTINLVGWLFWGTLANFNVFRVLASLLHRRRSAEANQALHDVWRSSALVRYYYTLLGALAPQRNSGRCKIHFASKFCVLLRWQRYCTALEQWASAKLCCVVQGIKLRNFRRGPPTLGRAAIRLGIGPHSTQ